MDADELVDEYLAEHIDMVNSRKANWQDWQSYTDPFTRRKVWYDQEEDRDWLGGHDDPSTDTKSPFELMSIP